jgi:hypothetical protein
MTRCGSGVCVAAVETITADFPLGQGFSTVAAGAPSRIPEAIAVSTGDPSVEMPSSLSNSCRRSRIVIGSKNEHFP